MSMKDKLRHAFAVEKTGEIEPSEDQKEVVDKVCRAVVRRRMTVPALMALEMSRPRGGWGEGLGSCLQMMIQGASGRPSSGISFTMARVLPGDTETLAQVSRPAKSFSANLRIFFSRPPIPPLPPVDTGAA